MFSEVISEWLGQFMCPRTALFVFWFQQYLGLVFVVVVLKGVLRSSLFWSFPKCACLSVTHKRLSIISLKVCEGKGASLRPSLETYSHQIYLISSLHFSERRIGAGWEIRVDQDLLGPLETERQAFLKSQWGGNRIRMCQRTSILPMETSIVIFCLWLLTLDFYLW